MAAHHERHGNYPDERERPAPAPASRRWADFLEEDARKHEARQEAIAAQCRAMLAKREGGK